MFIVLIWFCFYINRDLSVVNSTLNFYVATRGSLLDVEWDEEYLRRCGSHKTEGECGTEIILSITNIQAQWYKRSNFL